MSQPLSGAPDPSRSLSRAVRIGVVAALAMVAAVQSVAVSGSAVAGSSNPSANTALASNKGKNGATANLLDNGGAVLATSHTYALWWGDPSAWTPDVQPGIASFLSGLNGSPFLRTAAQYMRGAPTSTKYEGSTSDTSTPPSFLGNDVIGAEIAKVYGPTLDPNGLYLVYISTPASDACSWHAFSTATGQPIVFGAIVNTSGVADCDPGNKFKLKQSEGLLSLTNATSHEFMESITDPLAASGTWGWLDNTGWEMGDKCAWRFKDAVKLTNGTTWQLQEEWSNTKSGCVQVTR